MLIYFNGDSNVAGSELREASEGMAFKLTEKFDGNYKSKFINDAVPGASNDLIYDQTMDFLKNPNNAQPDLVVIGWTQFSRIQWFLVDDTGHGKFWEINKIGVGLPVPAEYKERYDHYVEHVQRNGDWVLVQSAYWHNKIFNLHKILEHKKIPHLFFNAFEPFLMPEDKFKQDWNSTFLSPYSSELIYTLNVHRRGHKEITPGWQHYDHNAHAYWADIMYKHIKEHKLV